MDDINRKKIYQMIARIALVTALMTGVSGILPHTVFNHYSHASSAYAAEIGTVTVTAHSLWTYSKADWNARVAVVNKGMKLTAVEKLIVAGRSMYRLSNGRYVTANTAYISFAPAANSTPSPSAPATQTPSQTMVKTTANLNMRTGSSTAYSIITTIPKGTIVTSSGRAGNGWYQVSYKGKPGYVSNKYVSVVNNPAPAPSAPNPAPTQTAVKTTANLNMRTGGSTAYSIITTIPKGTTVTSTGKAGSGWYQVSYNGRTGYVSNLYVTVVADYSEVTIKLPYIDQYSPVYAPMGCEGASLLMVLHYKNYTTTDFKTFLDKMPKTERNPFKGFSSTPYEVVKGNPPIFQSIFPEALTAYGRNYSDKVFDISGYTAAQLKEEIDKGHPVVVYVTNRDFEAPKWKVYDMGEAGNVNIVDNMHIMVLTGYNAKGEYQVTDPANSKHVYWVSKDKFEASYNALKWAVVVR